MNKYCSGCGIKLQVADEAKDGYIQSSLFETSKLCRRCFKIANYNDYSLPNKTSSDFKTIIDQIKKTTHLTVYVLDILNFNDHNLKELSDLGPNTILAVTKKDLLPKSVKDYKLLDWFKQHDINILDLVIISSNNNYNLDVLMNMIEKYQTSHKVYFVGNTNAGKSTLVNKLIYNYSNGTSNITTSFLPSTTLDLIEIRLDDTLTLIDTPGIIDMGNINNYIDFKLQKLLNPKHEIRPRTFQIKPNYSLLIHDLIRIDYVGQGVNSFTFYLSNDVSIKSVKTINNSELYDLKIHTFKVSDRTDIVIDGVGWLKVSKKCQVNIYTIDKVGVFIRNSLI